MSIEITGETSAYTSIEWTDSNGDILFDGSLVIHLGEWVLRGTKNGYQFPLTRWRGRRTFLSALGAAIQYIEKNYAMERKT